MLPRLKHRILLLGSNPADTEHLDLDDERAAIDAELRKSDRRDDFELQIVTEGRATKLPGLIMRFKPRILHISGHGDENGELLFKDRDGTSRPADKATIVAVFGALNDIVQCVVLNACYSEALAISIAQHVDVVIGMRRELEDQSAIAFSAGFYEALGYGKSFAVAFELAKAHIQLSDLPDADKPVLHVRDGVDLATVTLPDLATENQAIRKRAIKVLAIVLATFLAMLTSVIGAMHWPGMWANPEGLEAEMKSGVGTNGCSVCWKSPLDQARACGHRAEASFAHGGNDGNDGSCIEVDFQSLTNGETIKIQCDQRVEMFMISKPTECRGSVRFRRDLRQEGE